MRTVIRFGIAALVLASGRVMGGTIHVSLLGDNGNDGLSWSVPKRTIQAGIDAAVADGHALVLVSNGVWSSSDSIVVTNAVTVRAFDPDPAQTVINGSGGWPVFRVNHPDAVVDGFRVEGIYVANAGGARGAGAYLHDGTIQNCVFYNNHAYQSGGGVYMLGGVVTNCVLDANYSTTDGAQNEFGGNIHMRAGTVVDSVIVNSPNNGGVHMLGGVIDRCTIGGNQSGYHNANGSRGAGIRIETILGATLAPCIVRNSVIVDNVVEGRGGGIFITGADSLIENCTIVGNLAGEDGGGIWAGSQGTIRNCIVWGNLGSGGKNQNLRLAANTTLTHTLFDRSPGVTGPGVILLDPQFIDPVNGDYRLLPGSLAIDAGDNQVWQETALDRDGNLRRVGPVDLGAFEAPAQTAGVFRASFTADTRRGDTALDVVFQAHVAGTNLGGLIYGWDFGNGSLPDSSQARVTNSYGPGIYTVSLAVTNAMTEGAGVSRTAYIIVSPVDIYVSTNGNEIVPYDGWATATRDIRWAFDNARGNDRVYLAGSDFRLIYPLIWREADGATILGGYQGTALSGPGAADPAQWPTVIRRDPGRTIMRVLSVYDVTNGLLAGVTLRDGFAERNRGRIAGAGIGIEDAVNLVISNVVVRDNMAVRPGHGDNIGMGGGGIFANNSTGLLTHSRIARNHVQENWYDQVLMGGGMQIEGGDWQIAHCEFTDNFNGVLSFASRAIVRGGGLYLGGAGAALTVRNSVIAHNMTLDAPSGKEGGGIYVAAGTAYFKQVTIATNAVSGIHRQGGTVDIRNSILWEHATDVVGGTTLAYCNTGDGLPGDGNLSVDPLFAESPVDFHLKSLRGRWTSTGWVKDGWHSPCIDAGDPSMAVGDEPWPNKNRLNLGAYGGSDQASMSVLPGTVIFLR